MKEKGKHSSVYLIGPLAIKLFRKGMSKNASKEWNILKRLKKTGLAPIPYLKLGRLVVMSRIKGKRVGDMSGGEIKTHTKKFLLALNTLDKMNIMKDENHRPKKHFMVYYGRVKLIDFERSKEGHGNVTQFLSYLRHFYPGIEKFGKNYKKTLDLKPILKFIGPK